MASTPLDAVPPAKREAFLLANSGLPGARANLELAQAAADRTDEATLRRWLAAPEEYLALCGAIGVGRLVAAGHAELWAVLRAAAQDARWRVREGVALGLQRVLATDPVRLLDELDGWVAGPPLVRRAAVAGACEPPLLKDVGVARRTVALVDRVTATLLAEPDRRASDVRTLRQALGYCWSVAVAADPESGVPAFLRLAATDDPDARWIVAENRKKKRLPAAAR
jgi:hypothetical protein